MLLRLLSKLQRIVIVELECMVIMSPSLQRHTGTVLKLACRFCRRETFEGESHQNTVPRSAISGRTEECDG